MEKLTKHLNQDVILTIQNKEKVSAKLTGFSEKQGAFILDFESSLPVKEINQNPEDNQWVIQLAYSVFGKSFSFEIDGDIQSSSEDTFWFKELRRGLKVELIFLTKKL